MVGRQNEPITGFVGWVRRSGSKRWEAGVRAESSAQALYESLALVKERGWQASDILVTASHVDANVPLVIDRPVPRRPVKAYCARSA